MKATSLLGRLGALALLAGLVPSSTALGSFGTALNPGGNVAASSLAFPAVAETLVATQTLTISGNPSVTGTLTVDVYRESGTGTLDFFYQLTNTSPTSGGTNAYFSSLNVTNFGSMTPFATSVGYFSNTFDAFATGTFAPVQISRTGDGGTVSFVFDPANNPSNGLPTATTTFVLFVSTNATSYNQGGTATAVSEAGGGVNLGSDAVNGVYQPTGIAVPEPASAVLMGLAGLVGLGVRRLRRAR